MELVNGHESFLALSNRGALSIFGASFKFARPTFFQESHGQLRLEHRAFGGILVSSAEIGVLVGLTCTLVRMDREWAARSLFVKDVASCLRRFVGSQNGQVSKATPDVDWEGSGSDENAGLSLPQ